MLFLGAKYAKNASVDPAGGDCSAPLRELTALPQAL